MQPEAKNYRLIQDDGIDIQINVSNPTEMKATIGTYTVYKVKGKDAKGQFECSRRYSQFDLIRQYLLKRWPGCFVPPIPQKKLIGNSDADFVEHRKVGLEIFCNEMTELKHLWYSAQFQGFVKYSGDLQTHLKGLSTENHQDIIKKYDQTLTNLRGKTIDTLIINKVLQFNKYLKKILPIITGFRETITIFLESKTNNYEQYGVLYNYVLPEYQKLCLSNNLDQKTDGKLIFTDQNDERLVTLLSKMKDIVHRRNFQQLLIIIQRQQRQINAFLDVYRIHAGYQKKVSELKQKQKQLEVQQGQLNAGKQSLFKSIFKSNIEDNKRQIQRQIAVNKEFISTYNLLSDLISLLLGFFEIDRFKANKLNTYQLILKQIAIMQVQFSRAHKQLANHILDNHNLM